MHIPPEHIQQLWQRYISRTATASEMNELFRLIQTQDDDTLFASAPAMEDLRFHDVKGDAAPEELLAKILAKKVTLEGRPAHRVHFLKTAWVRYAAAIIILFGIGAYLWNTQQKEKPLITETKPVPVKNDIQPGSNKAVLTLSDGRKVELTPEQGSIAENGINIQNANGRLEYGKAEKVVYNTMSTPRGGQYQLALPDGTNVWLNAASSITYPTAFVGNTRTVTIEGEAYFDVTRNAEQPFIVKTYKDEIRVLGTEFNVNAYSDEPVIKTSLIEGSVKVGSKVLQPGQAYMNGSVSNTNITQDVAWKNGVFYFKHADLPVVMRQISRWYNVDVHYPDNITQRKFGGELSRKLNLSQVLDILEDMQIHFRIEGKDLYITNKPS